MRRWILFFVLTFCFLWSAEGRLSVFTDRAEAEIYVDEEFKGRNYIKDLTLQAGSHYLKVVEAGKVIYKEKVSIYPEQTETVVVENFVEAKTDVASRGALEVEAERIRETRGNTAFGAFGGSPASGLSYKHWFNNRLGIQIIGYTNSKDGRDNRCGGRLLIGFSDKIFSKDVFSTYLALGAGRSEYLLQNDHTRDHHIDISEFAFGLEFKITDLAKGLFDTAPRKKTSVVVVKQESDGQTTTTEAAGASQERFDLGTALTLMGLKGLMEFSSFSLEIGGEKFFVRYFDPEREEASETITNTKFSGGFHFYF